MKNLHLSRPPLQEEPSEFNPLDGFSAELPVLEVAAEPPLEAPESLEESTATPEAQASVAEMPELAPELSEATLEQPPLEAYDFPEPTAEDIAALEALEAEISPETPIIPETTAEAESSPEGRSPQKLFPLLTIRGPSQTRCPPHPQPNPLPQLKNWLTIPPFAILG